MGELSWRRIAGLKEKLTRFSKIEQTAFIWIYTEHHPRKEPECGSIKDVRAKHLARHDGIQSEQPH